MLTNFHEPALSYCGVSWKWWKWVEMLTLSFWVHFLLLFLILFAHFNLYKLRNMLTKFREHALSCCGVMWKV